MLLEFVLFGNGGRRPSLTVDLKLVDLDLSNPDGNYSPVSFCKIYYYFLILLESGFSIPISSSPLESIARSYSSYTTFLILRPFASSKSRVTLKDIDDSKSKAGSPLFYNIWINYFSVLAEGTLSFFYWTFELSFSLFYYYLFVLLLSSFFDFLLKCVIMFASESIKLDPSIRLF